MKPLPSLIAGLLADFSSSPLVVTVLYSLILVLSLEGSLGLSYVNLATAARELMHSTLLSLQWISIFDLHQLVDADWN